MNKWLVGLVFFLFLGVLLPVGQVRSEYFCIWDTYFQYPDPVWCGDSAVDPGVTPPQACSSWAGCGCGTGGNLVCSGCGAAESCSCDGDVSCAAAPSSSSSTSSGGCPGAQSCPSACGYGGGVVPDGSCGTISCEATSSCCSGSCSSPLCGQADACGGTCSSSDNVWTYGACSYGTFERSSTNACESGTTSQSCFGTISGYFFDASAYSSCPSDFSAAPIMEIGTIEAASTTIAYTTTTDASGFYSIVARSPDSYNLTVLPREPGVTYMTTPKFICDGATVTFTGVSDTATRNYGFWRVYGGWFNSLGGGMYGGTGLSQSIPPSSPSQALIDEAAGTGEAGIPYVRTGTINLGTSLTASISATGFNATGTGFTGDRADYTYFLAKMGIYDKVVWDGLSKPTYTPGSNDFVIYTKNSNSSIGFAPSAGQKMIFLINGDVTIGADITIPVYANNPAFMAVIASGTITFKNTVSRADGWFVGKQLVFETLNDKINEKQFVGEGSFVGWDAISMQRDRGETNNSEPSETFVYRPDFMVNAPAPMTASYYVWRQENP